MRVTLGMMSDNLLLGLAQGSERLLEAQNKVSSGKRISRPSDDVPGTGRSMMLRTALSSIEQYNRNLDVAKNQLSVTSSALDSAVKALQDVRNLAVSAVNATTTPAARASIAIQLDRLSSQLAGIANTQLAGRYIFSGSKSDTATVAAQSGQPNPYSYQGDSNQFVIEVGPGVSITANVTGDMVFNFGSAAVPGTSDVFTMIESLKQKVLSGDADAVSSSIAEIDANLNNVIAIESQVGGRVARLDSNEEALQNSKLAFSDLLSKTEDADLAEAIIELQTRQNVYQAALLVASKISNVSLVDYMR